jgi:hypothetical protein
MGIPQSIIQHVFRGYRSKVQVRRQRDAASAVVLLVFYVDLPLSSDFPNSSLLIPSRSSPSAIIFVLLRWIFCFSFLCLRLPLMLTWRENQTFLKRRKAATCHSSAAT